MANASFSTSVCAREPSHRQWSAKAAKRAQRRERQDVCQNLTRGLTPGHLTA